MFQFFKDLTKALVYAGVREDVVGRQMGIRNE
jgi:hypothetical protein